MHEMSLAEGVLQLIEDSAKTQDFSRVKTVWLVNRQLRCGSRAMKFCFEAVVNKQHCPGGATVVIENTGSAWCLHCAEVVNVKALFMPAQVRQPSGAGDGRK